jgi:hypothetical protein
MDFNETLSKLEEAILWEQANFRPKSTGLEMNIFISSGYVEGKMLKHSPRLKVSKNYNDKFDAYNTFTVTISDHPEVIGLNDISRKDINSLKEFIKLNKETLLQYWNLEIDTMEMTQQLQKVKG